jgi:hypothetical protein
MLHFIESLPGSTSSNTGESVSEGTSVIRGESEYHAHAFSATLLPLSSSSVPQKEFFESSTSGLLPFVNAYEPLMIEVAEQYGHPYGMSDYDHMLGASL